MNKKIRLKISAAKQQNRDFFLKMNEKRWVLFMDIIENILQTAGSRSRVRDSERMY